ncbi:MAG: HAD hydrolase-like protein [Deltaproteobacteria bacterium]|nr:HAD hydrolase-like protein [Deltaproteobacteria bacterium]
MVVLFDFDGTLADSFSFFLQCINNLSVEFGHETIEDTPEKRRKGMHRIVIEDIKLKEEILLPYSDRIRDELKRNFREIPLFPSVKSVVKKLMRHHSVGIVSTNSERLIRSSLEKEGLGIELLVTDISLGWKAEALKRILAEDPRDRSEFVYVGDERRDIDACREAGIPIIAVTWGFEPRSDLLEGRPDYLIDEASQLLSVIHQLSAIGVQRSAKGT